VLESKTTRTCVKEETVATTEKVLRRTGFDSTEEEKCTKQGYVFGFVEALRLQNGYPAGSKIRDVMAARRKVAEEHLEEHLRDSVQKNERFNTVDEPIDDFLEHEGGSVADQEFLDKIDAANKKTRDDVHL
jgi:hypothetical protein